MRTRPFCGHLPTRQLSYGTTYSSAFYYRIQVVAQCVLSIDACDVRTDLQYANIYQLQIYTMYMYMHHLLKYIYHYASIYSS